MPLGGTRVDSGAGPDPPGLALLKQTGYRVVWDGRGSRRPLGDYPGLAVDMRNERDPGTCGLEREPFGLVQLLRPQFPVSFRRVRESKMRSGSGKSFIASMMAAQDGCHSLGKLLEPHFPLVQPKGRTQGPGYQVGQSRPGALSCGSVAAGKGAIPIGWARHHLLSSEVPSALARGYLVGLKDGSRVSLWDS